MQVLACSKSRTRKQMVALDFWAQTASEKNFFIAFGYIWKLIFFTWPWPDLQFSLLKMPSDRQTNAIIELRACGQNGPENLCRMTYILLQNVRDLLWPSFDLKCTLCMLDTHSMFNMDLEVMWRNLSPIWLVQRPSEPKCKHAPYVNNFDFDLTCDITLTLRWPRGQRN